MVHGERYLRGDTFMSLMRMWIDEMAEMYIIGPQVKELESDQVE